MEFATWDETIYVSGYLGYLNALLGLARAVQMTKLCTGSSYEQFCNKQSPSKDGLGFEWSGFMSFLPLDIRR